LWLLPPASWGIDWKSHIVKTYPFFVNGEFRQAASTFPVVNPANGEPFAAMSSADRPTVANAIDSAAQAFRQWRDVPGKARGEFLFRLADQVHQRRDEFARTVTLENGKPLSHSLGEVDLAEDHLRWFAGEARRGYGRVVPPQLPHKRHLVLKTPVGVVAAIAPWNFPLMLAVRKIAPALAAGCTVVLKPASQTPLSAVLFAECVQAAQLPANVFQFVTGSAGDIGAEFLENPLCRKITFTGSTEVGRKLIAGAALQVKSLSLELGGLAPLLVFEDADLDNAVEGIMIAKFRNTGQSCIAANRVYVQQRVYDAVLEKLAPKIRALKVGNGLEPDVQIGPLVNQAAVAKAQEHVNDALGRGARLVCGGKALPGPGFFFEPTLLADVPRDSMCLAEETFAPVLPVLPFETESEALELANNTPFGLSAYAFTRDISRVFRLGESLEAGIIGINDGLPTASHTPFGGVKWSGWGRELGQEGMEAFLDTKHISIGL
jgi:succinate-semialdehyde dehydrogenase/glutarate-semialdehyde dehydrogenase